MTQELRDAMIVRLQPVRETDLIVVFVTPERGRVDAYARAARKSMRRFGGRLEPFVLGRAELGRGRGALPTLRGFEPAARLLEPGASWEQLALASYFLELSLAAAQPEHADPQLHAWLRSALLAVAVAEPADLPCARVAGEISWLAALGQLAPPMRCIECGSSTAAGALWTAATHGPLCARCAAPAPPALAAPVLVAADRLSGGRLELAPARALAGPGIEELARAIAARVADALPRPPRSLAGLDAVFSLATRTPGC